MPNKPKISIITPSRNTGRFARETIESILEQTYKDWEHIVVDGASTDETLEVIRQYPHIRWISEKDSGPDEAFRKGMAMAQGEYVTMCCLSDGYLDKNWFKKCVEILDSRPEIALVWGIDQYMREDGSLDAIVCNAWFRDPPPSGKDYIYYWLIKKTVFHERDFLVRKSVLEECFPVKAGQEQAHIMFNYNFNTLGYMPYLIKSVAAYGRLHSNGASQRQTVSGEAKIRLDEYLRAIKKYRRGIINGKIRHNYRDGSGKLLDDGLDLKKYFRWYVLNTCRRIKTYLVPPIFIWLKEKWR